MRIVFMGTPNFSIPALDAISGAGHEIIAVFCQPPKLAGRGKKERISPVHMRAKTLGLPVFCPQSLRQKEIQIQCQSLSPDVIVVVAYGLILPKAILQSCQRKCLNIHASLLPRWRGAAPIQRAIMAGDRKTGICIMKMEEGLDTGPVLLSQVTNIGERETAAELHDRLAHMSAELIVSALERLSFLDPVPQLESGVTYAKKINKAESHIDWLRSAQEIDCQIRGLSPFPGAWFNIDANRIKLLASCKSDGKGKPGEVLDDALKVACGSGAVRLLKLQRQGKKPQNAKEFLRGFPIMKGSILVND
ncbi:MAG: methionyl-tRNA formyltransferase [Aestuariivita sp.]|nr:methionyl-tRNA formyltransferase [Aestuariivita sp.]